MSGKFMHDTIATCEKIAALSPDSQRVWFFLHPHPDTCGRYPANPKLIKAACVPLIDDIDEVKIAFALREMEEAKLIHVYHASGKPYLVLHDHPDHNPGTHLRNRRAKYPAPPKGLCRCIEHLCTETPHVVAHDVNHVVRERQSQSLSQRESQSQGAAPPPATDPPPPEPVERRLGPGSYGSDVQMAVLELGKFLIPSPAKKAEALADLARQKVPLKEQLAFFHSHLDWDFYACVNALRPSRASPSGGDAVADALKIVSERQKTKPA